MLSLFYYEPFSVLQAYILQIIFHKTDKAELVKILLIFKMCIRDRNGLEVSEVYACEESLEDYFKRVTGGEGIA